MDNSHITTIPLEIKWLTQRLHHPYINMKTSLHYIHKLYLLNITAIIQLTQNCGTELMSIQDIQRQYGSLTRVMHKSHQKLQILFYKTTCTVTCPPTCPSHAPPLTLFQEFIIPLRTPPTSPIIYPTRPLQSSLLHKYRTKLN